MSCYKRKIAKVLYNYEYKSYNNLDKNFFYNNFFCGGNKLETMLA